jgi:hypothetical protein
MSTLIFAFAALRDPNDHLLTEAARVALEANPTPPLEDHDEAPIEIPRDEPLTQIAPPLEAEE